MNTIPVCDGTLYDLGCATTKGVAATNLSIWVGGEMIQHGTDRWNQVTNNYTPLPSILSNGFYITQGEAPYKDLQKMRRLYQVFTIDLRTDEIEEFQCIATSERSAELKAIAAQGIIDEIDNYQIVVRALASVQDRIDADD